MHGSAYEHLTQNLNKLSII